MAKKPNATQALTTVVSALEDLTEADKLWILKSAAIRWSLVDQVFDRTGEQGKNNPSEQTGGGDDKTAAAIDGKDVRSFIRLKKPATDVQRVACLGYFQVKTNGVPGFSSKDIGKLHVESGGSAINMTRALDNATRQSKYISNRGAKEKQLTPLGEDVVEALPDQQAVKSLELDSMRPRKAKRKATAKKKA
jgi:hypothetical protein